MQRKNFSNNQGFTLLEILVTIFIIGLLSTAMLANYKQGNRDNELNMKAEALAANIRWAQNNTLGSVKYGDSVPSGGWGVYLKESKSGEYVVFANINYEEGNLEYDEPKESDPDKGAKTLSLGSEVEIKDLNISGDETGDETEELHISFLPPDPQTIIYDGTSTGTEASIILESNSGREKTVKINSFGLIEVSD